MIEIVRHTQRNVKRWQDSDMRKCWTAAGMLQAEAQFRRIVGYSQLAELVTAIEHRHHMFQSSDAHRKRRAPRWPCDTGNAKELWFNGERIACGRGQPARVEVRG